MTIAGKCEMCEPYFKVQEDLKGCVPATCEDNQKILKDTSCENCPKYMRS